MQYFTIRHIEKFCQVKAHTLRTWEQRYELLLPKRKKSLKRTFNSDDVKQLLRIAFLYHNGWKISKIAVLTTEKIAEEVRKAKMISTSTDNFMMQLIEAAVDFNEASFMQLLDKTISTIGFEKCITEVCYPYLQRMGLLRHTDNITPAPKHFSSYLIQNKVIAETAKISTTDGNSKVLLFCPKDEHHELPLLFLNYLLRKNSWSPVYLGLNITKQMLQNFAHDPSVEFLFLHHITNFTEWNADSYFEDLCRTFQNKNIIATGTVVHQIQRSFTNLRLLKSDKEIYEFVEQGKALPRFFTT